LPGLCAPAKLLRDRISKLLIELYLFLVITEAVKALVSRKLIIISIAFMAVGCREVPMKERKGLITMKGGPLTLLGTPVSPGSQAPDFEAVANDLSPVKFAAFRGKVCIISSVPSLDTRVCDIQTRRFNEEAQKLGDDVVVLTISMDLPFAQKRWCAAAGIKNLQTLSDHRDTAFGRAYGLLIKELRLLARSVIVVDKQGIVRYAELVTELTNEPNYDAALKAAKQLL
jgi:thiol peroxidase